MKNLTITLTLLITITLFASCSNTEEKPEDPLPQVETMIINKGNKESFQVNGEVTAGQETKLTAELRSTVTAIKFKPGDQVKKGQLLISLYSASVNNQLITSGSSLTSTKNTLAQTQAVSQNNIQTALKNYEQARLSLENTLKESEQTKQKAKNALSSAKLSAKLSTDLTSTNLNNTILSAKTNIQSALDTADGILGLTPVYAQANDSFENSLGSLDITSKTNAESGFQKASQLFSQLDDSYDLTLLTLRKTDTALANTLSMLHKSSTGVDLPQAQLDTFVTTITAKLSAIRASLSALSSAKSTHEQALNESQTGTSQTVINAESEYNSTLTQLQNRADTARKQLEIAKTAHETAQSSAKLSATNVSSTISGAGGAYRQALIDKEKLSIKAPFDGTIVDIYVKPGDEVSIGNPLAYLENANTYKITAHLTPTQSRNLHIGDTVKIGKQSQDTIHSISGTIDSTTKKYKIEILHKNPHLHSGQYIPLLFTTTNQTNNTSNTILIPLVATHVNFEENYVWKLDEENKTIKQPITLGEISGNKIEILTGLSEGDTIIIKGGRMLKKAGIKVSN